MKNAKTKRSEAKKAAVWYAREIVGCVITCWAVGTQFQFGSDIMGKLSDGSPRGWRLEGK